MYRTVVLAQAALVLEIFYLLDGSSNSLNKHIVGIYVLAGGFVDIIAVIFMGNKDTKFIK